MPPEYDNEDHVELNEAVQRILRRHAALVLVCLMAALGMVAFLHRNDQRMYTSLARVALDGPVPKSSAESTALADTARAVTTSQDHITASLRKVRVNRDPVDIATHRLSVRALGSSNVVELSVTDPDRKVAKALANALAADLVDTRVAARRADRKQIQTQLDRQIGDLTRRIAAVDVQLDKLNRTIVSSSSRTEVAAVENASSVLRSRRENLVQEKTALGAERLRLPADDSASLTPRIVESADLPLRADPTGWRTYFGLAALLGLVVGVGLAAVIETFRPTLMGPRALARAVDAPVLSVLPDHPERVDGFDSTMLVARLHLAAGRAGVETVVVLPGGPSFDVPAFLRLLGRAQTASIVRAVDVTREEVLAIDRQGHAKTLTEQTVDPNVDEPGISKRLSWVRVSDFNAARQAEGATPMGLVLVAPTVLKKAQLEPLNDLLEVTGWPLLGVIPYRRRTLGNHDGLLGRSLQRVPWPVSSLIYRGSRSERRFARVLRRARISGNRAKRAVSVAQSAGEVRGFVRIFVAGGDPSFVNWATKRGGAFSDGNGGMYFLASGQGYMCQNAYAKAFAEVLRKHDIEPTLMGFL